MVDSGIGEFLVLMAGLGLIWLNEKRLSRKAEPLKKHHTYIISKGREIIND